jgi:H+/Cl- antiporter ClcA
MEAVVLGDGKISTRRSVVKCLSAMFTIASGGSIGREGPLPQILTDDNFCAFALNILRKKEAAAKEAAGRWRRESLGIGVGSLLCALKSRRWRPGKPS